MNKTDIIEELLRTRDNNLMMDALWEDMDIVQKIRVKLTTITKDNLAYYTEEFMEDEVKVMRKPVRHLPLFKGIDTDKYVRNIHGIT